MGWLILRNCEFFFVGAWINTLIRNNSVLPFCADASTESYLQELALRIHREEAFAESPDKRFVVGEFLKGVMAQAAFDSTGVDRYGHPLLNGSRVAAFIITCIEAGSNDVACLLVDKLASASAANGLAPSTLTLIEAFSHLRSECQQKKISPSTQPCIIHLLSVICNLVFDKWDSRTPESADDVVDHISAMLNSEFLQLASSFDVFFTRYGNAQLMYLYGINLTSISSLSSRSPDALSMQKILKRLEPHFAQILQTQSLAAGLVSVLKRYALGITMDHVAAQAESLYRLCLSAKEPHIIHTVMEALLHEFATPSPHVRYNVTTGEKNITSKTTASSSFIKIAEAARINNVLSDWGPYLCKFILAWTEMDKEDQNAEPVSEPLINNIRMTLQNCKINLCSAVAKFLDDVSYSTMKIEEIRQDSVELKHLQSVLGTKTSVDVATLTIELKDGEEHTVTVWVSTSSSTTDTTSDSELGFADPQVPKVLPPID